MKNNKKYLLIISSVVLSAALGAGICLAAKLEVPLPGLTSTNSASEYIGTIIKFLFGIAGAVSTLGLIIGAVLYLASAGNTEKASDAKDRMVKSILGLVLTLSCYLIAQTINPQLVTVSLQNLTNLNGVYLTNGTDYSPSSPKTADTSTLPKGYDTLTYTCKGAFSSLSMPPKVLVWTFQGPNFQPISTAQVRELDCKNEDSAPVGGSFYYETETPGIYLFTNTGCQGFGSEVLTPGVDNVPDPFVTNIKSIRIVNDVSDPTNTHYYGVIFHEEAKKRGGCSPSASSVAYATSDDSQCMAITAPLSSYTTMDLFSWNNGDLSLSGTGVTFYSKAFGWENAPNAGSLAITNKYLGVPYLTTPDNITFDYTGSTAPQSEQDACGNFQSCPGSIKLQGSYLVVLYNGDECETFTQDVPKVAQEWLLGITSLTKAVKTLIGTNVLTNVAIIPLKP